MNAAIGMVTDLGETNSIDVVNDLVSLEGLSVIDVGCGDMTFSRVLAAAGARVLAVDPDPLQAEQNRAADPTPNLVFKEARAERLPAADGSIDGVFFSFSLHHVPEEVYPNAFAEINRVLKPDGFLCVIEPLRGPLEEVAMFFHDETHVRAAAQKALGDLAVPAFKSHRIFRYHSAMQFESFEAFVTRYSGLSYNQDYTEADVRRPEVEELFERLGQPTYRFETPKQMMFLQGLKSRQSLAAAGGM